MAPNPTPPNNKPGPPTREAFDSVPPRIRLVTGERLLVALNQLDHCLGHRGPMLAEPDIVWLVGLPEGFVVNATLTALAHGQTAEPPAGFVDDHVKCIRTYQSYLRAAVMRVHASGEPLTSSGVLQALREAIEGGRG